MISEFIHEEISMLFCSKKFYGGGGGYIAIIATSSLRDLDLSLTTKRSGSCSDFNLLQVKSFLV